LAADALAGSGVADQKGGAGPKSGEDRPRRVFEVSDVEAALHSASVTSIERLSLQRSGNAAVRIEIEEGSISFRVPDELLVDFEVC
jgi:hypothetical protein